MISPPTPMKVKRENVENAVQAPSTNQVLQEIGTGERATCIYVQHSLRMVNKKPADWLVNRML